MIELHIRDFAVIDEISLEFSDGLIALTGETGAGKSILVDALSLLLGERASTDVVRAGADRSRVEGVFDVGGNRALLGTLEELGYPAEDGLLILRREVARQGRSRAWVNGSPATVRIMAELAAKLADLHSQHEYQNLLRSGEQRRILDAFAGADALAADVEKAWSHRSDLEKELAQRVERNRELAGRADFLRFQSSEIRDAAPVAGEDDDLEAESGRLAHAEELAAEANALYESLYGAEGAAADRVASAMERVGRLSDIDPTLAVHKERLEEAYHLLAEAGREFGDYASSVEHDPARLEAIQQRLDLLTRLKRKYGSTLTDVLETAARVERELGELDGADLELADLERRIGEARSEFDGLAARLTAMRADAARSLSRTVQDTLPGLGLGGATFQVLLARQDVAGPGGAETIEFRASLNPGFEPKPLSRIASGGELSRVMLALKSALVNVDPVPTLVFDEVDAGVGGAVATYVAEQLATVARQRQVFVITHLAQVASRATHHYRVEKRSEAGSTSSGVERLGAAARVQEIARMLGGDPDSEASRAHAAELLTSA